MFVSPYFSFWFCLSLFLFVLSSQMVKQVEGNKSSALMSSEPIDLWEGRKVLHLFPELSTEVPLLQTSHNRYIVSLTNNVDRGWTGGRTSGVLCDALIHTRHFQRYTRYEQIACINITSNLLLECWQELRFLSAQNQLHKAFTPISPMVHGPW